MLQIQILRYDELSEKEKKAHPEFGFGCKYANYLKVVHNEEVIALESDAMEPEDAIFHRDLDWIKGLVLKAYTLGLREGL